MRLKFWQRVQFAWQAFKHTEGVLYGLPISFEAGSDIGCVGVFINHKGEQVRKYLF